MTKPGPKHTLEGHTIYPMPAAADFLSAVTDTPCPEPECAGTIRTAMDERIYGYRICDGCNRHYLAWNSAGRPILYSMRQPCSTEIIKTASQPPLKENGNA
jgi:hypothetical protein